MQVNNKTNHTLKTKCIIIYRKKNVDETLSTISRNHADISVLKSDQAANEPLISEVDNQAMTLDNPVSHSHDETMVQLQGQLQSTVSVHNQTNSDGTQNQISPLPKKPKSNPTIVTIKGLPVILSKTQKVKVKLKTQIQGEVSMNKLDTVGSIQGGIESTKANENKEGDTSKQQKGDIASHQGL